jgi:hypothetical protein
LHEHRRVNHQQRSLGPEERAVHAKGATVSILAADLIAANPGPAAHMALVGIVVIIGLIAFAVVRTKNKREAAEAAKLDQPPSTAAGHRQEEHQRPGHSPRRH